VKFKVLLFAALAVPLASPAMAAPSARAHTAVAPQLSPTAQARYREIFAAIHRGDWASALSLLDAMPVGPLHDVARAEIYLGKGSPYVEGAALADLAARAPYLPHAPELIRLAKTRGVERTFAVPSQQELTWLGSAPRRARAPRSDSAISQRMQARIQPLIKDDRPNEAEAIIIENQANLSPEILTEWQERVAWSYFITGDDAAARRLGSLARKGVGAWAAEADWVVGLASWREKDYATAAEAFEAAAQRHDDEDMRAAAQFWAARCYMALGQPQKIDAKLKSAARNPETFYGMLALKQLGINAVPAKPEGIERVERLPNVSAALALAEIGEKDLADKMIRHEARIGNPADHAALSDLAGRLDLPSTQLWLAQYGPSGARSAVSARYPRPKSWTPEGGWRVDSSLVFAHALQESQMRTNVVSGAGARGLMQVRPGTAGDIARSRGQQLGSLAVPSTNLEYGQSYIEQIRDGEATGGMLPKVIAAYNSGPTPVARWNAASRDGGDPLLYIESIPYWETRAYVTIVMRNYWMYQLQDGDDTASRNALAQGMWPRFPGLPGAPMVRLDQVGGSASAD
jgi:soluble lytic murein transglycosylase